MIEFDDVGVTYADQTEPVLSGVNLHIPEGELCLVIGRTGSGKTTLLRALSGMIAVRGSVTLAGTEVAGRAPEKLARMIRFQLQQCRRTIELTPPGRAAVAVILVAGPVAVEIVWLAIADCPSAP